jgi:predicted benzoate:H+ symporter BenE
MQDKVQILKVTFAGAIILAAVLIMLPGIMDYLTSLSRMAIYISIAIVFAVALSFVFRQLKKSKSNESK